MKKLCFIPFLLLMLFSTSIYPKKNGAELDKISKEFWTKFQGIYSKDYDSWDEPSEDGIALVKKTDKDAVVMAFCDIYYTGLSSISSFKEEEGQSWIDMAKGVGSTYEEVYGDPWMPNVIEEFEEIDKEVDKGKLRQRICQGHKEMMDGVRRLVGHGPKDSISLLENAKRIVKENKDKLSLSYYIILVYLSRAYEYDLETAKSFASAKEAKELESKIKIDTKFKTELNKRYMKLEEKAKKGEISVDKDTLLDGSNYEKWSKFKLKAKLMKKTITTINYNGFGYMAISSSSEKEPYYWNDIFFLEVMKKGRPRCDEMFRKGEKFQLPVAGPHTFIFTPPNVLKLFQGLSKKAKSHKLVEKPKKVSVKGLYRVGGKSVNIKHTMEICQPVNLKYYGHTVPNYKAFGHNAVRFRNLTIREGKFAGKKFIIKDDNEDAQYNGVNEDTIIFNKKIVKMGDYVLLGPAIYELKMDGSGLLVNTRKYVGPTGTIKIKSYGVKPAALIFKRKVGKEKFLWFNAMENNGVVEVPAGEYMFYGGLMTSGKGKKLKTLIISSGLFNKKPLIIAKNKIKTIEVGNKPFFAQSKWKKIEGESAEDITRNWWSFLKDKCRDVLYATEEGKTVYKYLDNHTKAHPGMYDSSTGKYAIKLKTYDIYDSSGFRYSYFRPVSIYPTVEVKVEGGKPIKKKMSKLSEEGLTRGHKDFANDDFSFPEWIFFDKPGGKRIESFRMRCSCEFFKLIDNENYIPWKK